MGTARYSSAVGLIGSLTAMLASVVGVALPRSAAFGIVYLPRQWIEHSIRERLHQEQIIRPARSDSANADIR